MEKSSRITVRLTEENRRRLTENSVGEQLTKSQIIRKMIDNYDTISRGSEDSYKNEMRIKIKDTNTTNPKPMNKLETNGKKGIIQGLNTSTMFKNIPTITNDYIIESHHLHFSLTPLEESIINEYFLKELGYGYEKIIDTNSPLITLMIDFSRFYRGSH